MKLGVTIFITCLIWVLYKTINVGSFRLHCEYSITNKEHITRRLVDKEKLRQDTFPTLQFSRDKMPRKEEKSIAIFKFSIHTFDLKFLTTGIIKTFTTDLKKELEYIIEKQNNIH